MRDSAAHNMLSKPQRSVRNRIHFYGASGTGVTTLGKAVAEKLNIPFFDSDDYGWEPTIPKYQRRYPVSTRVELLHRDLDPRGEWVLSGSIWSLDILCSFNFTLVVFLHLDTEQRLKRLGEREVERYGKEALPGGTRYEKSQKFLEWAASYDEGPASERSLKLHHMWLEQMPFPSISLKTNQSVEVLANKVIESVHA